MGLRTNEFIARANYIIEHAISFGGFSIIKHQKMFDIIDRLEDSIPEDIKEAERILKRRDDIIANANYEAERIKNEAFNERERILSESELLRAVQQEAAIVREKLISECEEIKNKAYADAESIKLKIGEEARALKAGAADYAEQVLADLEESLARHQAIVKNGQMRLEEQKAEIQRTGTQQYQEPEYTKEYAQEEFQNL